MSRIFRFDVLAESGLYDGWAHTKEEMREKFVQQVGDEPCEVFFAGGAPRNLTYSHYQKCLDKGLSLGQIAVLDMVIEDLDWLTGEEIEDQS